ncbi:MAG: acyl carrier protein [Mogibacterium sp.]|nr:acyl carrier protein [Mogibacterium sp.]
MKREEIFGELKEIVLDYLGEDDIRVSEDSSLTEDLGLTSLDLISIVGDIEDSFGISVEDEAMDSIETVGDVLDYIEGRLGD